MIIIPTGIIRGIYLREDAETITTTTSTVIEKQDIATITTTTIATQMVGTITEKVPVVSVLF